MDPNPTRTRNELSQQIERDGAAVGALKFVSDDWRTWHFQSTDDPNVYWTVDLAAWDNSGACSCPVFDLAKNCIRRRLELRLIRPHTDAAKCKHIRRAEKVLCYRIKKKLFQNPN